MDSCYLDKCNEFSQELIWYCLSLSLNMLAPYLHSQTFRGSRGKNVGKDVVLLATGKTLSYYTPPVDRKLLHVGVNRALLYDKIVLDQFFAHDWRANNDAEMLNALMKYKNPNLEKFLGIQLERTLDGAEIPLTVAHQVGAKLFLVRPPQRPLDELYCATMVEYEPLGCFFSIVFPVMQYLLYTRPNRIYLVGCDAANSSHYIEQSCTANYDEIQPSWAKMADFAKLYYPDVEIISINPVGLRGMFKDLYTTSNPDRPSECEYFY